MRGFWLGMGRCGADAGGLADGIPLEAAAGFVAGLSAVAAGADGTEAAGAETSRSRLLFQVAGAGPVQAVIVAIARAASAVRVCFMVTPLN